MERIQRNLWLLLAVFWFASCSGECGRPPATAPDPAALTVQPALQKTTEELDYVEFVTGSAGRDERLPMIVAIHGLGDSPEGFSGLVRDLGQSARIILPRAPEKWNRGYSWFSVRGSDWENGPWVEEVVKSAKRIAQLIAELQRKRPTQGKPLVMGFSQGGILSFTLAIHHPEVVGLAVPLGGFLPNALVPDKGTSVAGVPPIVALNGEGDTVIPFRLALSTMTKLKPLGVKIRLQGYPNVRHQVPPPIRADLFKEIRGYLKVVGDAEHENNKKTLAPSR